MKSAFCNYLFRAFEHRICCGQIPEWTAHVGRRWRPIDDELFNLYNVIWLIQAWIRNGMDGA